MEWYWALLIIIGILLFLFMTGLPIAFCFLLFNCVGAVIIFGSQAGLNQFMVNMVSSISKFALLSLPLFILMGSFIFGSGIATKVLDVAESLIGKMPGRLSFITVLTGAVFGAMSGSTMAATSILGTSLLPDMLRRKYHPNIALGPIMGSAGLSMIIPPSGMAIILASTAGISIAALFMAGYIPGLIIAAIYAIYIIIACALRPSMAPSYEIPYQPVSVKLMNVLKSVIPVGIIIFSVMGLMFFGIATPSESAALGALAAALLAIIYKKMTKNLLTKSCIDAAKTTGVLLFILVGASAFAQIVSYTGVLRGLSEFVVGLAIPPVLIMLAMLIVVVFMGMIIDETSIVMITIPIFMPLVKTLGIEPLWFCLAFLICQKTGGLSPPFGMVLFTMKSVAPSNITMANIYAAGFPFFLLDLAAVVVILLCPPLATWLPSIMGSM